MLSPNERQIANDMLRAGFSQSEIVDRLRAKREKDNDPTLGEQVGDGIKTAFTQGARQIADDFSGVRSPLDAYMAVQKAPIRITGGVGAGVGKIAGGVFETLDDLTGEVVSDTLSPVAERISQTKVAQNIGRGFADLNERSDGVLQNAVDTTNLIGAGAVTKGAVARARSFKQPDLKSVFKTDAPIAPTAPLAETLQDTLVEGAVGVVDRLKRVPEAIGDATKSAVGRRLERVAKAEPTKAREMIIDLYKRSVVPGVKKKKKTIGNIENIEQAVLRIVPDFGKRYDINDLEDFATAVAQEKKTIWSQIDDGLTRANAEGKTIDLTPLVEELDTLAKSERAKFSRSLRVAIDRARAELVDELEDGTVAPRSITPAGAQDLIADLNAQLQSYFRGSTSGTNADVIVEQMVLNNLRKFADDVVEELDGESFASLKSRYADLKKIEDDVVHRAVFEAQKGGGLADLTDIFSAGDIVAGAYDPAFLAKGLTQTLVKDITRALHDKNELVRQMFIIGKNLEASAGNN